MKQLTLQYWFMLCLATVTLLMAGKINAQQISRVDENGKLLVYEEDFLPFGFYCEALAFDEYPNLAQQIAAGGFNYIYAESYYAAPNEIEEYLTNYEAFLQLCHTHGIYVVNGLLWQSDFPNLFATYVNTLKPYPALICWNLMDDANSMEISEVVNQKEQITNLDQSRVTSISFCDIEPPAPYMMPLTELAYMQSYPWGLESEGHDLSLSDFLFRNHVLACQNENIVPIATPQTFNWENETYPSPAHVDCQTYLAFIAGMKGVLYYTFKDYDNSSTIDVTQPAIFNTAANVASEILQSEWKDVILHGQHQYYNINQFRYYATWRYNDAFYLAAVNASPIETYLYEIPLPVDVTGDAINFFDYRPDSLSIQNGILMGELAPYEVAIYKMKIITNINDDDEPAKVAAFPNPVENSFHLSGINAPYQVDIFDVPGSLVTTKQIRSLADEIDVSKLKSGVYFVKVISKSHHQINSLKIIKK